FPDAAFEVSHSHTEPTPAGDTSLWFGKIDGMPRSQVILAQTGDYISGSIETGSGAFYPVRTTGGTVLAVGEVAARPDFGDDAIPIPASPGPNSRAPVAAPTQGPTTIDVLVVYTAAARVAAGGTLAMQNLIDAATAQTNMAYANSGVQITVRVVAKV